MRRGDYLVGFGKEIGAETTLFANAALLHGMRHIAPGHPGVLDGEGEHEGNLVLTHSVDNLPLWTDSLAAVVDHLRSGRLDELGIFEQLPQLAEDPELIIQGAHLDVFGHNISGINGAGHVRLVENLPYFPPHHWRRGRLGRLLQSIWMD